MYDGVKFNCDSAHLQRLTKIAHVENSKELKDEISLHESAKFILLSKKNDCY
jgi:hypothetical protein